MSESRFAVLEAPRVFSIDRRRTPSPAPREALLHVVDCGVCGSDLKMWNGTHAFLLPPLLLGHEIHATVEAFGATAGETLELGESVVVFPPVGCGSCFLCLRGQPQLCADMRFFGGQLPGGLAEYITIPEENLLPVRDGVADRQRVLIEPLAVGVHAVARARVEPGEAAVVLGAGAIGLFTALVARARGADPLLVVEPSESRRRRAAALGLEAFDLKPAAVPDAVAELIRPEGADVVFECVGSAETIDAALAATRKGGRAAVVGNAPAELRVDGLRLQRGDRSLVGVLMYERGDFQDAMAMLAGGLLAALPEQEVVEHFALDDLDAAFAAAKDGTLGAIRAVVRP